MPVWPDDHEADAGGWLAAVREALRKRPMPESNPDAPQMSWEFQAPLLKDWLLQSLMFGGMGIGASPRSVAGGVFRPRENATFDQRNLSPTLQTIYRNGTPEQQAEAMRIWEQLHRRPPAQDMKGVWDSIRRAPEPHTVMSERQRAMREFEALQAPPRSQMHGLAAPTGALGAYLSVPEDQEY